MGIGRIKRKAREALALFGLDTDKTKRAARWLRKYRADYKAFSQLAITEGPAFPITRKFPILGEHLETAGDASGHYFHQDLHVARRVFETAPARHLDVGSRVDGFVAHVATFRAIDVVDIRPLATSARNINFLVADLQDPQATARIGLADSVSCLHAVEHFGLGRYGDPLDADGHVKGIRNIAALVAPGGRLYMSVPMGPQRVEFNAHRVFAARTIPDLLASSFVLEHFSFVDDAGELHENAAFTARDVEASFGCRYGCGIYEFRRVSPGA